MAEIPLVSGALDIAHATARSGRYDTTEHHAALAICARARNRADAALLLEACGLLRPGAVPPRRRRPARRCRGCGYVKTRCACGGA